MYNKYYNDKDNNYGEKRIDPYSRDRRYNNENDFNKNNDLTSPLKISSSLLMNRNKERFQNENLTVHRVSPVHYQYKAKFYENYANNNNPNNKFNDERNYNNEREGNFQKSISNNNYMNTDINNMPFKGNNNEQYQLRNNNNQRYRTPNHYNNNNYNEERNNKNDNEMRRKNSDINIENNNYYLKDPCDYYKGEEIDDGFRHYNPEDNDYNGSRYGGYIYNYYLNAPMRSDKSEDWRFPPLYYYNPNYDSKRKIYTNYH